MDVRRTAALLALALAAPATGVAWAQGGCDINDSSPFQLNSAKQYLGYAASGKPDEQKKHARNAVRVLTENPERINNQLGRNYLLGRTLVWWATTGGAPSVVKRGDIGYATNPDATIDVGAAIDTAFAAVEGAKPACRAETEKWRKQLWVPAINAAGRFVNDNQLDSAEFYLRRANTVWSGSPLPTYYSAIVAQRRGQADSAAVRFSRAAEQITPEALSRDTTLAKIREQSLYNSAMLTLDRADHLQGEPKAAQLKEAAARLQAYIAAYPSGQNVGAARTALARALGGTGDTTAAVAVFSTMLADPTKYSDLQLFEGGTAAYNARRYNEALKLFEAGLQKNPSYRDALYNTAKTYLESQQFDKALDMARRSVAVDPNNPDNWLVVAAAYRGMIPADPGAAGPKAQRDAINAKRKALVDSVAKYKVKADSMPLRISGLRLQHAGDQHTLTGSIENRSAHPSNVVVTFEFLDGSGNVVSSQEQAVTVPPKATRPLQVQVNGSGIVAFRYRPVG